MPHTKLAIVTDIHMEEDNWPPKYITSGMKSWKLTRHTTELTTKVIEELNTNIQPDFVLHCGDLISDSRNKNKTIAKRIDRKRSLKAKHLLDTLHCPVHYVMGNHDTYNQEKEELEDIFGKVYYSFETPHTNNIILYTVEDTHHHPSIDSKQVEWLEAELARSTKPTIIYSHHPLVVHDTTGNHWNWGPWSAVKNRDTIHQIIKKHQNVIAGFNGHLHHIAKTIENNIPFFSIQSLIENPDESGFAAGAYASIEISNNSITVDVQDITKHRTYPTYPHTF